jgi:hypothetical protein
MSACEFYFKYHGEEFKCTDLDYSPPTYEGRYEPPDAGEFIMNEVYVKDYYEKDPAKQWEKVPVVILGIFYDISDVFEDNAIESFVAKYQREPDYPEDLYEDR